MHLESLNTCDKRFIKRQFLTDTFSKFTPQIFLAGRAAYDIEYT